MARLAIILIVCGLSWSTICGQSIGHYGKRVSITSTINVGTMAVMSAYSTSFQYLPEVSLRYVSSRTNELNFSVGMFDSDKDRNGNTTDRMSGMTYVFGIRTYRYKKHGCIAPVGRFWDLEATYITSKTNSTERYNYNSPEVDVVYNHAFLLPTVRFGRQMILYDRLLINMGVKFGTWPFIVTSAGGSNVDRNVRLRVYRQNLLSAFATVGVLL